ncbi:pyruvate dehydrogenase (acetyl-transferring) E1 component subunit alpha [Desulfonema ishimotonii]|uniref:Pyruvate dehydrogenase E1 component subunit alpha n=1 Tax=Desulfonema ishimotonii TaxID=45657 RepID=A0A401G1C4_9BACT|nr:pyruvate dehydrogenase (acetyl-transferring) E1 component subunit alpha [Desulfonema ishimotonii]GBC63006.1 pyruvate dehydrogenase (acetyl-transferring) E1 component subunit alpha [Desulfonema ishimotonii]
MPRHPIKLPGQIDWLAILDENGVLDESLEPEIPDDLLRRLYRAMVLAREFDARLLSLQRQGRIGTFPPITGQEAASLGAVALLRPTDWMVPAFRETPAEIWRGRSLESIIIGNNGFNEGGKIEEGRNDLPVSIPVGTHPLHAVGLAWAMKYRKKDDVALTFFGDGATSEGDVHEAFNFAAVYDAPVIFLCQNNQWAISIPRSQQTRSETIAQKALAYGMAGIQVDGNDILAVYAATREAVERARAGKGPTLIECVTYRVMMHTTADDPSRYRSDEEVEKWQRRDPLKRFQIYLKHKNLLTDPEIESVRAEVLAEIQTAVDRAEAQMKEMGDPPDMFNHAYETLPPHLAEQRDAMISDQSAVNNDQ